MTAPPWILLNPGPVNLSDGVRTALLQPDLCHRESEFQELLRDVRRGLLEVFGVAGTFTAGLVAGSGTAAVEAMIHAALPGYDGVLLSIENGVYGERMTSMATRAGIPVEKLHFDWTEAIDPQRIDDQLARNPDIRAVSVVHHETTTGRLNPIENIGAVVRKHGRTFVVDSVSGLAAEPIDLAAAGIDLVACTANKAIHGVPGVSFVLVSHEHLARLQGHTARSLYLDLAHTIAVNEAGSVPFTMPVQVLYALRAALQELQREGVAQRAQRFASRAGAVRQHLAQLGIRRLLPDDVLSNSLTAFHLPSGVTYQALHDQLKELGFIIYAGQGHLAGETFRIAHMGEYVPETTDRLLDALTSALG